MTVHGPDLFFARLGSLTCTAAPVFAPDATLAGVLDASSEYRTRQQHTQALVAMAATQIENGLFRANIIAPPWSSPSTAGANTCTR